MDASLGAFQAPIYSKAEILVNGAQPDIKKDDIKKEASNAPTIFLSPENHTGSLTLQGPENLAAESEGAFLLHNGIHALNSTRISCRRALGMAKRLRTS